MWVGDSQGVAFAGPGNEDGFDLDIFYIAPTLHRTTLVLRRWQLEAHFRMRNILPAKIEKAEMYGT